MLTIVTRFTLSTLEATRIIRSMKGETESHELLRISHMLRQPALRSVSDLEGEKKNLMTTPVVLITGALTGIGRATALAFARDRARVVVSGRSDEEGQELTNELRELGAEAEFVDSDVRHDDDLRNLVDRTVARFGRLAVAVNCAGTEGKPGPLMEQTAETYAATFDTNVLGTLLSMKHEMRVMLAQ